MNVSLIYKETLSLDKSYVSNIEIIEADESHNNATKYSRMYSLQLHEDDKKRCSFKTMRISVR